MSAEQNIIAALRLASCGIAIFPCSTDKRPRPGIAWRSSGVATTDEIKIRGWWTRWPDSIPAFELGRHGLIAIDCDRHGGPDGVAGFYALAAGNGDDPRDWPTVETPSTGRHVFFANPDGLTNRKGALPDGIDVRGSGGYVVAEGATLPDGRGYVVPDGLSGLCDAMEAGAVPNLPPWLAEILVSEKVERTALPSSSQATILPAPTNIGARERAAYEAALSAERNAVASAGKGNRNNTLNTAAFNLGQIVGAGWCSRGEVETALYDAAIASGLGAIEARKTIASGIASGMGKPRPALSDRSAPDTFNPAGPQLMREVINPATGEVTQVPDDHDDDDDDEGEAQAIDEGLTRVGGVLGELVDFICASALYPNRRLALGAALTICGTLLGRKMATPTQSGLHLYVIATFPTGGGKQHQLDAIDRIFRALKLDRHIGPSQFMSMSALVKHVHASPLSISPQDEFGAVLKKLAHPRASSHEQGISAVLRGLWGLSFSTYKTPAYATASSVDIRSPALSIYGPTTPDELYEALRGKDVVNGFLNRFLVIDGGERTPKAIPTQSLRSIPASLRNRLYSLYSLGLGREGDMGEADKNGGNDPDPVCVPFADEAARLSFEQLVTSVIDRMDRDKEAEPFLPRVAENALRCATILACTERPDRPAVTLANMQWGAALAWQSADKLISDAARYMVDPLGAADFERKIMTIIKSQPNGVITLRNLHRKMQRHFRYSSDLKNALDSLTKSRLLIGKVQPVNGGERITYRIA